MTDRWTESRMSRRIKGGLNGQIVTSSNMIQLGRWTEVGTMDRSVYECGSLVCLPPLPLILLPFIPLSVQMVSRFVCLGWNWWSVGQCPLVLWSVQMVSRSVSSCPLVGSDGQ